jgi:hypothetical protein
LPLEDLVELGLGPVSQLQIVQSSPFFSVHFLNSQPYFLWVLFSVTLAPLPSASYEFLFKKKEKVKSRQAFHGFSEFT